MILWAKWSHGGHSTVGMAQHSGPTLLHMLLTRSTRTAIMAAAPVDTVQSIRITWSSLMSLGSRR